MRNEWLGASAEHCEALVKLVVTSVVRVGDVEVELWLKETTPEQELGIRIESRLRTS